MLDSPLFKQIITVQDSLQQLGEYMKVTPNIQSDDFDFTPTGELHLFGEGIICIIFYSNSFSKSFSIQLVKKRMH